MKRILIIVAVIVLFVHIVNFMQILFSPVSFYSVPPLKLNEKKIIIIDASKGGSEIGADSPTQILEKDVNLKVAQAVAAKLAANPNFRVFLTRNSDRTVSLDERLKIVTYKKAHALITITSSEGNEWQKGYRVEFSGNNAVVDQSKKLAENIGYSLRNNGFKPDAFSLISSLIPLYNMTFSFLDMTGIYNPDILTISTNNSVFQLTSGLDPVIQNSPSPAVLISCGYITSISDLPNFYSDDNRKKLAVAIEEGLIRYFSEK